MFKESIRILLDSFKSVKKDKAYKEYEISYTDDTWIHIFSSFGMVSIYCKPLSLQAMVQELSFFYVETIAQPRVDSTVSSDWLAKSPNVYLNRGNRAHIKIDRSGRDHHVNLYFDSDGQLIIIGLTGNEFLGLCNSLLSEIEGYEDEEE